MQRKEKGGEGKGHIFINRSTSVVLTVLSLKTFLNFLKRNSFIHRKMKVFPLANEGHNTFGCLCFYLLSLFFLS